LKYMFTSLIRTKSLNLNPQNLKSLIFVIQDFEFKAVVTIYSLLTQSTYMYILSDRLQFELSDIRESEECGVISRGMLVHIHHH
jgi:hypothetical protein